MNALYFKFVKKLILLSLFTLSTYAGPTPMAALRAIKSFLDQGAVMKPEVLHENLEALKSDKRSYDRIISIFKDPAHRKAMMDYAAWLAEDSNRSVEHLHAIDPGMSIETSSTSVVTGIAPAAVSAQPTQTSDPTFTEKDARDSYLHELNDAINKEGTIDPKRLHFLLQKLQSFPQLYNQGIALARQSNAANIILFYKRWLDAERERLQHENSNYRSHLIGILGYEGLSVGPTGRELAEIQEAFRTLNNRAHMGTIRDIDQSHLHSLLGRIAKDPDYLSQARELFTNDKKIRPDIRRTIFDRYNRWLITQPRGTENHLEFLFGGSSTSSMTDLIENLINYPVTNSYPVLTAEALGTLGGNTRRKSSDAQSDTGSDKTEVLVDAREDNPDSHLPSPISNHNPYNGQGRSLGGKSHPSQQREEDLKQAMRRRMNERKQQKAAEEAKSKKQDFDRKAALEAQRAALQEEQQRHQEEAKASGVVALRLFNRNTNSLAEEPRYDFITINPLGNGDCLFSALGINREDFVDLVQLRYNQENSDDSDFRDLINLMLIDDFNNLTGSVSSEDMENTEFRALITGLRHRGSLDGIQNWARIFIGQRHRLWGGQLHLRIFLLLNPNIEGIYLYRPTQNSNTNSVEFMPVRGAEYTPNPGYRGGSYGQSIHLAHVFDEDHAETNPVLHNHYLRIHIRDFPNQRSQSQNGQAQTAATDAASSTDPVPAQSVAQRSSAEASSSAASSAPSAAPSRASRASSPHSPSSSSNTGAR